MVASNDCSRAAGGDRGGLGGRGRGEVKGRQLGHGRGHRILGIVYTNGTVKPNPTHPVIMANFYKKKLFPPAGIQLRGCRHHGGLRVLLLAKVLQEGVESTAATATTGAGTTTGLGEGVACRTPPPPLYSPARVGGRPVVDDGPVRPRGADGGEAEPDVVVHLRTQPLQLVRPRHLGHVAAGDVLLQPGKVAAQGGRISGCGRKQQRNLKTVTEEKMFLKHAISREKNHIFFHAWDFPDSLYFLII